MDDRKFKKLFIESFIEIVVPEINRVDLRIDNLKLELDEFKNGAYNRLDILIGELKAFREEQSAHAQRHDDVDQTLDDYGKRISQLESPSVISIKPRL